MTKSELKSIIRECLYESNIITESGNNSLESLEKWCQDEEERNYFNKLKKDKSWLVKILNKCSEEAFKSFRSTIERGRDKNDNYDKEILKDLDEFYKVNKKAPKVDGWDWPTSYIDFWYECRADHDMDLFYQDEVMKYITKNQELKSKGYRFTSDDYIGITIITK